MHNPHISDRQFQRDAEMEAARIMARADRIAYVSIAVVVALTALAAWVSRG